jgi:hypothetical protein
MGASRSVPARTRRHALRNAASRAVAARSSNAPSASGATAAADAISSACAADKHPSRRAAAVAGSSATWLEVASSVRALGTDVPEIDAS